MLSRRASVGGLIVVLVATSGLRMGAASPSAARSEPSLAVLQTSPTSYEPAEGATLEQTVHLNILGGSIELETTTVGVVLHQTVGSGHSWVGMLPPVRVVDARGTLEGWEVRWFLQSVEVDGSRSGRRHDAKVDVQSGRPVVVDGAPDGLQGGSPGGSRPPGRVLFQADPGTGGGTYEADGTVSVQLPGSVEPEHVVVVLSFALR